MISRVNAATTTSTPHKLPDIIKAAYDGNHEGVADLLKKGVSVNTVDPDDNLTLLHIACMQGDLALVKVVLAHDAIHNDVNFEIKSTYRPRLAWQFAINRNFPELADLVDEAGFAKRGKPLRPTPL